MNPFKVIAVLACLFALSYIGYVVWQSSNVPKTIQLASADSFKSIPATVCTIRNNDSTVTGTLNVFHDAARFDITSVVMGKPISVHVLVSREDNAYFWVEGEKTGSKGDYGPVYSKVGLAVITHVDCTPWWFPNGTSFIAPMDVSFGR